jgi:hypothetical protein
VPPNDPTNSHQAVAILKGFGFDVRYQGKGVSDNGPEVRPIDINKVINSLWGRYKDTPEMVDDREREHQIEEER